MSDKYPRLNVRVSRELRDCLTAFRGERSEGAVVREALENLLNASPGERELRAAREAQEASGRAARVVAGVQSGEVCFKCPRDCKPSWRPTSPKVRCPECRAVVVPA